LGAGGSAAPLCSIGWGLERASETAASHTAAFSVVLYVQEAASALGTKPLLQNGNLMWYSFYITQI
jgi:hypothetical protein